MNKSALALTALLVSSFCLTPAARAEEATRAFSDLQSVPLPAVALVDDSTALPLNPGAAGARDLFEVYVNKSVDPTGQGRFATYLGLPNVSLGFDQFQAGILGDLRTFSAAYTYPFSDFISFGVGYHLTQQVNVPDSNVHSFDAGLLIRPARFLSFGLVARNLNTPFVGTHQIRRAYAAGVGVRPLGERLTLTADVQWDEGDDVKDISALFGLETEPLDGILLRGSVDLKGQFMLGLGVQFDLFNTGYYHSFNGTQNTDGLHVQVTNALFENAAQQIGNHFAYIDLSDGLEVDNGQPPPLVLSQNQKMTYWQLLRQLKLVKTLNRYKGVIVDVGPLGLGLGLTEEVRAAFQELRDAGKQVIVYLNEGGMSEYYLATAADEIVLHPMGSLRLNGFAYVMPYYRDLLDTVGVGMDFVKVGYYKTGMESYTLNEASKGTLEEYQSLQNDDFQRFSETLEQRRQLKPDVFQRVIDKTLFSANESKETGLVDKVAYRDQLDEIAADLIHQPKVSVEDLSRLRLHRKSWESRDRIAVVYVSGTISEGRSGRNILFGGEVAGAQSIVSQIYQAMEDDQVKALVLRVNSPGGSALASDEIYRALIRFKEKTKRPVVVSMADMAASGGYWISLAGDKILANPSTLTGSIGIFAGKLNLEHLYQWLGVHHTVIKTNEKADQNGNHRPYTDAERQLVQNNLRDYYRIFLQRVSDNRQLDIKQVEQVAQGRVYTGAQALKFKLVDQLGTLPDAIRLARKMADVRTEDIEVMHLPGFAPLMDDIGGVSLGTQHGQLAWQAAESDSAQSLLKRVADQGLLGSVQTSLQQLMPENQAMAMLDPEFFQPSF